MCEAVLWAHNRLEAVRVSALYSALALGLERVGCFLETPVSRFSPRNKQGALAQMKVKKPLAHRSIVCAVCMFENEYLGFGGLLFYLFPVRRHISYDVFIFILYALLYRSYLVYNPLT